MVLVVLSSFGWELYLHTGLHLLPPPLSFQPLLKQDVIFPILKPPFTPFCVLPHFPFIQKKKENSLKSLSTDIVCLSSSAPLLYSFHVHWSTTTFPVKLPLILILDLIRSNWPILKVSSLGSSRDMAFEVSLHFLFFFYSFQSSLTSLPSVS